MTIKEISDLMEKTYLNVRFIQHGLCEDDVFPELQNANQAQEMSLEQALYTARCIQETLNDIQVDLIKAYNKRK